MGEIPAPSFLCGSRLRALTQPPLYFFGDKNIDTPGCKCPSRKRPQVPSNVQTATQNAKKQEVYHNSVFYWISCLFALISVSMQCGAERAVRIVLPDWPLGLVFVPGSVNIERKLIALVFGESTMKLKCSFRGFNGCPKHNKREKNIPPAHIR